MLAPELWQRTSMIPGLTVQLELLEAGQRRRGTATPNPVAEEGFGSDERAFASAAESSGAAEGQHVTRVRVKLRSCLVLVLDIYVPYKITYGVLI